YAQGNRFLLCKDTLKMLQHLALLHRTQLRIPFIGITGSNGKTTTKELIHAVLSKKFNTLATEGNLNNHIGVPLTLLRITDAQEMAIIEMGANHAGEIRDLCALSLPGYGLITSIGKAHLEGFGSFEGVIKAKSELYDHIRKNKGHLFVNADNDLLLGLSSGADRICYGGKNGSLVKGTVLGMNPYLSFSWEKTGSGIKHKVCSHLIGQYNFDNFLAAVCVGLHFGVDEQQICEALEAYIPTNNRSELRQTTSNTLILDAYNSNPSSLTAAIDNFSVLEGGTKVLIAGDMLELGPESGEEHQRILNHIGNKHFDVVILVGKEFESVKAELQANYFHNAEEALIWLQQHPVKNSTILIKGSRGIKLEKLVAAL
ncbi:MAG TPA: UDP-N-acetylmuramoyl-tripeptide--D-alanyl-D-alanine ligase, partial [Bacteroidia bacterium]|nr:UDP-N-acetylmuramoyl-tripeptide--D-alanyl-D-alanine ligase [Bacteroidia bacterium]